MRKLPRVPNAWRKIQAVQVMEGGRGGLCVCKVQGGGIVEAGREGQERRMVSLLRMFSMAGTGRAKALRQ